jgi:hypothetical protein
MVDSFSGRRFMSIEKMRVWMDETALDVSPRKLAFLGAFLPRRCRSSGVITRLCNAIAAEFGDHECLEVAVSDVQRRYSYPSRVRFEIAQADSNTYRAAADFLNLNDVDLVCIQYDFEIFDGEAGVYLLSFVKALKMPVVCAFYAMPFFPGAAQRQVIDALARLSSGVLVYEQQAGDFLPAQFDIPAEKVMQIRIPGGDARSPDGPAEDHPAWREMARRVMGGLQLGWQAAVRQKAAQLGGVNSIPVTGSDGKGSGATGGEKLPVLKLDHFLRMTDETGMLKASVLSLPDYRQGYTTADNARALMFSLLLEQVGEGPFIPIEMQASRHLAFLWNAFNAERGRFRGALSYQRDWQDEVGSEDTHGRLTARCTRVC